MICARLSLCEGQPFAVADVSSSTLYCVPYAGNDVELRDGFGGSISDKMPDGGLPRDISDLPPNSQHDVFLGKRNGALVLATAPMGQSAPPPVAPGIVLLTGTPQGALTYNGGLLAAVDGLSDQAYLASARSAGGVAGYSAASAIGLHFASPQAVNRIEAWSPTDNSFIGNNGPCAWQLRAGASVDSAAVVASGVAPGGFPSTIAVDVVNAPTASDWWLVLCGNGINAVYLAEMKLYGACETSAPPPVGGEIGLEGGLPVNETEIALDCDAGPFVCGAGKALYMGSLTIGPTAGVARIDVTYKPDVRCDVWNYFNEKPITLRAGDNRPMINGSRIYTPLDSPSGYNFGIEGREDIRISIASGLKRRKAIAEWQGAYFQNSGSTFSAVWTAIGVDSTSVPSGTWAMQNFDNAGTAQGLSGPPARCVIEPFEGRKVIRPLEGRRGDVKAFWQEVNQGLTVDWEY